MTSRKFKILFSFGISLTHVWDFNFLPCISNRLAGVFNWKSPQRFSNGSYFFASTALIPVWWEMLTFSSGSSHFISWQTLENSKSKSICATLDEFIMSFRVRRTNLQIKTNRIVKEKWSIKKNAIVHSVRGKQRAIPFENSSNKKQLRQ